jgi:hypothetical protein
VSKKLEKNLAELSPSVRADGVALLALSKKRVLNLLNADPAKIHVDILV